MAMSFLKPHCTHRLPSSSSSILNSPFPTISPTKSLSANGSSFSTRIPNHFRALPISSTPTKPFSFKAFSSQISASAPKPDEMPARVGFLGLGIMGSPMAQNLIKAGNDMYLLQNTFVISGGATLPFGIGRRANVVPLSRWVQSKAVSCGYKSSPKEVAASCDVTFAMLADPQSALDVACGEHGAAKGMSPGKGYVDVSTVDGATSKLIGTRIKATGALFLEAPVSGSKKPAEDGQLIFLTAGDRSLFETVAPLLDVMGKSRFFLGDVGNGAAMKLVVNMIMGSMMASFSEGLLLSESVGLDPKVLVEVVSQGAISAPMFSMKGPSMVQSLYPTAFPLKHQQKDLRLALGLAESVSQPTPIAAAANELYKVAKSRGLSDEDFSAVIEALKVKLQSQSKE
ncbi:hypothetical protein RHMOL_Rhmol12G0244000 [Rhododendron molle]|uniref:Uncharacterized protein n=1 Tax=Rhododendron molle TaxID=49168 RepID=A0ACC0LM72_RHOML|nr:hypothetical protein RHMOL_Rhmol12G0244000 [Rhododendron molle]